MAELHPVRIDLPMPIRTQRLLIRPKHAGDGAITSAAVDIDWPGRQCDTGFWVRKSAQGQGFATEGATALHDYGFDDLGLHRIIGVTHPGNRASQKVLMKAGLSDVGWGRYYDRRLRLFAADNPHLAQ